jgi:hypothetical protein
VISILMPQRVPRSFTVGIVALWSFGVCVPSTVLAQHALANHEAAAVRPQERPDAQEGPLYDPKNEATFTGTAADVNTGGPGRLGWLMRVHTFGLGHKGVQETQLLLKTDTDTVRIHLGPTAFLKGKGVEIREGDTLEVTGSSVTLGDARVVLAREIRKGDNVWTLREATGQPLWSSAQTEARGFWTTKKVLLTVVVVKVALLFTVLRH